VDIASFLVSVKDNSELTPLRGFAINCARAPHRQVSIRNFFRFSGEHKAYSRNLMAAKSNVRSVQHDLDQSTDLDNSVTILVSYLNSA
jgi:hypothetical protein